MASPGASANSRYRDRSNLWTFATPATLQSRLVVKSVWLHTLPRLVDRAWLVTQRARLRLPDAIV